MSAAPAGLNAHAHRSFADATAYEQHRPTYTAAAVQALLERLGVVGRTGARLIDLGAGTGKLTTALAARPERFEIVAVEPHEAMRDVLAAKQLPRVEVVAGAAEGMPGVRDGEVDAVVVAQAFHWFANMTALREIHRVLRRHGTLGLIWNVEDYNAPRDHPASTPWEGKLHRLTWETADGAVDREPRFRDLEWRKVFDEQVKKTPISLLVASGDDQLFSLPIGEQQEPFQVALPAEQVWERYRTLGQIAVLAGEARERAHRVVQDAIAAPEVERNQAGEVIVHGHTHIFWTSKIPAEGREALTEVESPRP